MSSDIARGLAGVIVDETRISLVDGKSGRLLLRGETVQALSGSTSFEGVCARILDVPDTGALTRQIADGRGVAFAAFARLNRSPAPDVMDSLRADLAGLPSDTYETPGALIGAVGVALARWMSHLRRVDLASPDPRSAHAGDVLRLCGLGHHEAWAKALEAYLVAVIDHGFNASTFAARVVTSTGSDPVSAVVSAVGALKGPLHGGAPGPVLDMLDAIADPSAAEDWIRGALDRGERIMGMGHRVYRVRDPRAEVLERALRRLADSVDDPAVLRRLELARAVEAAAEHELARRKPGRKLRANVEFYTAVLLDALGFPRQAFTGVFAAGRVAGWCAHIAEQREHGKLIRPRAAYIGPGAPPLAPAPTP